MAVPAATAPSGASDPIEVVSFGCRINLWESAVIREQAREAGLSNTVIINTCAVTAEAERQARQGIRRLRRERPDLRIVVTGCAAQIAPARWAAMPEVDRVLGNAEKLRAGVWREPWARRVEVGDAAAMRRGAAHSLPGIDGHSRAFVQVQNGCDHRCTFCIIPFGRGPSRSLPLGAVAQQVRLLVANGYREAVLSGVDLGAWGADLPGAPGLGHLVRRLLALVPELDRLRLSSLDPVEVDDELVALMGEEPRLMPHLHLSLQSGDDLVLKRMRRRHRAVDVLRLADRVRARRPDVAFGADLIAGFPTESEAMFAASLRLVEQAGITWLHVFPFSPRPGTPASRMPQVPSGARRERAAHLRALGEAQASRFMRGRIGSLACVLVERDGNGRSEHFAPVRPTGPHAAGSIVTLRLTGLSEAALVGETPADIPEGAGNA